MKRNPENRVRFADAFFEARYHIALCRYRQSTKSTGEQQQKYLQQARRSLSFTTRLYPDLGSPEWKRRFKKLEEQLNAGTP